MTFRIAANCSMLFTELPLRERPAAARAAGFDAVECWWPFSRSVPGDGEVEAFARAIEDAGVRLVAMNLAAGELTAGERGLVSWPGRESEFRDSVDVAAAMVARLGVTACNVLYGNRVDGVSIAEQDQLAVENYTYAARALADVGALALLEPLSGVPAYPLRRAADVVALIDRVADVQNLRLLADVFHLATNGDDLSEVIADHVSVIGHVQLADVPGRHEPGTGTLPFDRLLHELHAAGYQGWVALEYEPLTSTEAGLPAAMATALPSGAAS